MDITVRFIGSGDAFGSGGRLQTCILIDCPTARFAIDFGATSLVGMRQQDIDPNTIDAIILTHLHGDHCGGVPFLLLDAMLGAKRERPLTIAGPTGMKQHLARLQTALFPGSESMKPRFEMAYLELRPGQATALLGCDIKAVAARHTPQTNPLAVRIQLDDLSVAYTGDGEYTESLAALVAGADLLIAECYFYSKPVKWHLNYPDISRLSAKHVVLTHMHTDMLEHTHEIPEQCAHDGLVVSVR